MLSLLIVTLGCSASPPPEPPPAPEAPPAAPVAQARTPAPLVKPVSAATPGKRRIVAIGDLHGDRTAALEVLQLAGLTDRDGHWIAGDTIFVQTGDLTDRGPDSRGVIDLLRSVQAEGNAAGGTVHLLNGNHEVMNLQGDWRYVSDEDLTGFGGRLERLAAFSPTGEYGAFLATLPVVVKVDDTVFAHGGVHPEFAAMGIDAINRAAQDHYFDPLTAKHPVHDENGPTWFRGYSKLPEAEACALLDEALTSMGASRMVVGHTTSRGDVNVRCDGKLAVIDVGISAHYGHHLAAWESIDGDARALQTKGTADIVDP